MRLHEASEQNDRKIVVFAYGRMNPPTIGHKKLINTGKTLADNLNADFFVFPTRTHDREKNPLNFNTKLKFLKIFFPEVRFVETSGQLFVVLKWLVDNGYTEAHMIAGSDRVNEFNDIIKPYISSMNKVEPGVAINFETFRVVDAGQRDPDEEGAVGASGAKAREFARTGQESNFVNIVAPGEDENTKKELYRQVRKGMGIE